MIDLCTLLLFNGPYWKRQKEFSHHLPLSIIVTRSPNCAASSAVTLDPIMKEARSKSGSQTPAQSALDDRKIQKSLSLGSNFLNQGFSQIAVSTNRLLISTSPETIVDLQFHVLPLLLTSPANPYGLQELPSEP